MFRISKRLVCLLFISWQTIDYQLRLSQGCDSLPCNRERLQITSLSAAKPQYSVLNTQYS